MAHDFHQALASLLRLSPHINEQWWIIGGAATSLITGGLGDIHDIDVLLSPTDARRLIGCLDLPDKTDGGTERFRSEVYATWMVPSVPIDLLGGFQVKVSGHWTPIRPKSREPMVTPVGTVFLPSVEEHIAITRLLGRPRDFERIRAIRS